MIKLCNIDTQILYVIGAVGLTLATCVLGTTMYSQKVPIAIRGKILCPLLKSLQCFNRICTNHCTNNLWYTSMNSPFFTETLVHEAANLAVIECWPAMRIGAVGNVVQP